MLSGTVRQTGGGVYRIALDDDGVVEASIRGRLKREARRGDRVVIGDRVEVEEGEDGAFTIETVLPRESEVVRRGAGGHRMKVVAANVERLVIVVAGREPSPHLEMIDRLMAVGEANGLEVILVVNKVDLPDAAEEGRALAELYGGVGYRVFPVSARSGRGMEAVGELLCSGISVLAGPSGAGKSSLLNALEPSLELRTGELSRKVGRGRHTTVSSRLIPLGCGGMVADTPGFSDVGVWGVEPEEVEGCFPEIREVGGACRFQDCRHRTEPDCAVREAVEAGEIPDSRYRSYLTLRTEAEEMSGH